MGIGLDLGIGLDFGTTNSSLAIAVPNSADVKLARFTFPGGVTESFRSLLYLERLREGTRHTIKSWSGPDGIERYLHSDDKGRLVQSLKSFLASRSLLTTEIFGRRFRLEDLVANVLRDIRTKATSSWAVPCSLSARSPPKMTTTLSAASNPLCAPPALNRSPSSSSPSLRLITTNPLLTMTN